MEMGGTLSIKIISEDDLKLQNPDVATSSLSLEKS
jgi:hypothetical protein